MKEDNRIQLFEKTLSSHNSWTVLRESGERKVEYLNDVFKANVEMRHAQPDTGGKEMYWIADSTGKQLCEGRQQPYHVNVFLDGMYHAFEIALMNQMEAEEQGAYSPLIQKLKDQVKKLETDNSMLREKLIQTENPDLIAARTITELELKLKVEEKTSELFRTASLTLIDLLKKEWETKKG